MPDQDPLPHKTPQSPRPDTLFQDPVYPRSGFVFDTRVAEVFDDMLQRSIPRYHEVMEISRNFLLEKGPGGILYDLGSSTGNFLLDVAAHDLGHTFHEYRGIDNSPAMVEKAEMKLKEGGISPQTKITFTCGDLLSESYPSGAVGGFVLHYTLQFIDPKLRGDFLKKIHSALMPGGLLILSEKVVENSDDLKEYFIGRYHHFKAVNQYSREEIARKKEALEDVLIPFPADRYGQLLAEAGFRDHAIAFKWYNFTTWFAVKNPAE